MQKLHYDGPIVLVVMDGVGLSPKRSGNAVRQAHTEFLDNAMLNYLNIPLAASGEAVGIMPGQMGNSEVGHNALGSGQIIKQGVAGIEEAFSTGDIWRSKAWTGAMKFLGANSSQPVTNHALHFAGIFSDGGVHSDIKHLEQMVVTFLLNLNQNISSASNTSVSSSKTPTFGLPLVLVAWSLPLIATRVIGAWSNAAGI